VRPLTFILGGIVLAAGIPAVQAGRFDASMLGTWVAALLTLAIFSFLYKDNPVYKLAEHIFIGVSAGYVVALEYWNVFIPNLWNPLIHGGNLILIAPFALGLLLFTRFAPRAGWLSRWAIAAMVGSYAGFAVIGALQGDLVAQIRASMMPLYSGEALAAVSRAGTADEFIFAVLGVLANPLILLGLVTTLMYFFFSREHKGSLGAASRVGIWFLMVSFGASFGYTVMSRVSLLIGRLHFLMSDWLGIIQ
jgi:hypothetical protein